ncbi:Uncharacterised protein [Klebsiella aerogenes]|nr:Uncharacterised protein [Klebsiella aerogenes]
MVIQRIVEAAEDIVINCCPRHRRTEVIEASIASLLISNGDVIFAFSSASCGDRRAKSAPMVVASCQVGLREKSWLSSPFQ